MKKFLTAGVLASVLLLGSSFLVPQKETGIATSKNDPSFRIYHVTLTTTVLLPGFCLGNISIEVWFSWDGPGSDPVFLGVNNPQITSNCWLLTKTSSITNISADTDAHLTDIQFGTTGDRAVDEALADPKNVDLIKADFNDNIDSQKK